ncbi:MAG: hypothetical protein R3F59_19220 [Myxococcota bacterium]
MHCAACNAAIPDTGRFCPACGAAIPVEDPVSVADYRDAVAKLGRRPEAWARAELEALRTELGVRQQTHDRLMAELAPSEAAAPIGVWLDAGPIAQFRAGEQCVLRVRVQNRTARAIAGLALEVAVSAAEAPLAVRGGDAVGPGDEEVLSVWFRPSVAGHHRVEAVVEVAPMRGAPTRWATEAVPFVIGAAAALQQHIQIDARTQRVGVFENIGAASKGGLMDGADWRPLQVRAAVAAVAAPLREDATIEGIAVVVAPGDPPVVQVDGVRGTLVELHDPALRDHLSARDRLQVWSMGRDRAGAPLFTSRAPAARHAGGPVRVGPGDDLAEALRSAPPGGRVEVTGAHRGPLVVDRALTLVGLEGASVSSERGPALRLDGDVVVEELVVRGAAPAGQYAVDAVEVRSGRVVLERCTLSSDAPGNLVPGRAVAVVGPANLELRGCKLEGSGVGVAVDVSWSGFATDHARGARVRVAGCELVGLGTGVAVAGADREVRVVRSRFAGVAEAAVRVLGAGSCAVEDCAVPKRLLVADTGANLVVKA